MSCSILLGMTQEMTTVKIRRSTRELISTGAREQHCTIDEYLTELVLESQWHERMVLARRLMASPDAEYLAEVEHWDASAADGLS